MSYKIQVKLYNIKGIINGKVGKCQTELLNEDNLLLFNTENQPKLWQENHIKTVIETINNVHQTFADLDEMPNRYRCGE